MIKARERYIVFEIISEASPTKLEIQKIIQNSFNELFGQTEAADADIRYMEYSQTLKKGLLRCNHTAQQKLIAALALIDSIGEKPAHFHTLGVSGTVKKVKEKFG